MIVDGFESVKYYYKFVPKAAVAFKACFVLVILAHGLADFAVDQVCQLVSGVYDEGLDIGVDTVWCEGTALSFHGCD